MNGFVAAFVLLMWLPGHLAMRLTRPPGDPQRPWSAAERLFCEVSFSGVLMLWYSVSLGLLGVLTRTTLIAVAFVPTAALLAISLRRRAPLRAADYRPGATLALVGALVIGGTVLYDPPFEQIIGGRDPVTYMVSGIHLGRVGSWVAHDEIVTGIEGPRNRQVLLGTTGPGPGGDWGARLIGWYLMDPDSGTVVPQGLPLYPSAIAMGYMLADVDGALRTTKLLAIAGVVALFFLGCRLANPATGLTAALLLLLSPAQVWFSRFANAETLAQLLFVTGLYALLAYRRHGGWALGFLSAVAFGLSWQTHIWMVWIVFPLFALLVFDLLHARVDRGALLAFWAPLFVLGLQALAIYLTVTTAYLWGVYAVLRWSLWSIIPAIAALTATLLGMWHWGRRRTASDQTTALVSDRVGWPRKATAIAVVLAAAYGYLLRPVFSNAWNAESVQRLVLAVTLGVFVSAVAGLVLLLVDRRRQGATMCFLAVALGIVVPVLWEPQIQRPLMWSLRRYQTFLPLIFLAAALPLWINSEQLLPMVDSAWRRRWVWLVRAAVSVAFVLVMATHGLPYRGSKQPGESVALINEVAASLDGDAVLVFEARSGWGVLDLAPALAYWKGYDVLWVHEKNRVTNARVLRDVVRREAQRGRAVYFFTQGFNYHMPSPRMVPHGRWWFYQQQLEEIRGALPRQIVSSRFPFSVYRLEPDGSNEPLEGILDVGNWDDNYVAEALPWEANWKYSARWTKGTAFFWLPGVDAETREIVVHAMTVGDSAAYNRTLRARLDGIDLGEIPIEQDWTDYIFEVPSDWQPSPNAAPMLEISTQTLQPDEVNGNGDTRYLGVLVNAILWR